MDKGKFTIFFGEDSITLTTETKNDFDEFMARMSEQYDFKNSPAMIKAGVSPKAPTRAAAKKLAVARMLNTRNSFIDTGFNMKNLGIEIEADREIDDNYLWVEITIGEGE